MRDFLTDLLKALLVAELRFALPWLAKALVVLATVLFVPSASRARWREEWLGVLEELEDEGKRLALFSFALQKVVAAPGVGWQERTHGQGLAYLPSATRGRILNWRLQRLMSGLVALDRYALAKHDLSLKVKHVIIGFLAVPALWVIALVGSGFLAGRVQAQPLWWLLFIPLLLYIVPVGPFLFLGRFNTLLDTGILIKRVLTYPSTRAKLVNEIEILTMQVGHDGESAHDSGKAVVAQDKQLLVVGHLSQQNQVDYQTNYDELHLLNLGPGHLVVQNVRLQVADNVTLGREMFLFLASGETAPLLNRALVAEWVNDFNTNGRVFPSKPIKDINTNVTLVVKAAGADGPLDAKCDFHLRSNSSVFYLWHDAGDAT